MISNILIYVDDLSYLDDYRKVGVSAFLFGLKGYCVGYNTYTLDEILKQDVSKKYIMINRVLDCNGIDSLKEVLKDLKGVNGIVFEDIGVYETVKKMNLDIELILFQNHFGTNSRSINFWLDRVESMFVSGEITYDETKDILANAKKPLCLHLFGHNQVMYSRRLLLSNWSQEFNIPYKDSNVLEDKATHVIFRALENEYGTVMYSDKIFNGSRLLNLSNVLYYYVNPMLVSHSEIMEFLNDPFNFNNDDTDQGFMDRETIYKLKERGK